LTAYNSITKSHKSYISVDCHPQLLVNLTA
jgi:hypothetical protein